MPGHAALRWCFALRASVLVTFVPLPALLLAALMLWPAERAVAAELPAAGNFEWSAPAGCPSAAAVRRSLAELIELEDARWDRFESIHGSLSTGQAGWQLELRFAARSATQTRHFEARDCADLGELAALTLALALDPDSQSWQALERQGVARDGGSSAGSGDAVAEPPAPARPLAAEGPVSEDQAVASARLRPAGANSLRTRVEVGAGGLLDPATLGTASFGVSLWADAHRGPWSAGVYGDWLPQGGLEVGSRDVAFRLAVAGFRACHAPAPGLRWCPELELGSLMASGSDLDNGRSARDLWLAPGASAELAVPAGALALVARISVLAPLLRGRYLINEDEMLHRPPALTLRLALGLALPLL